MDRKKPIVVIGWEEGLAGQIDSWIEDVGYTIEMFIHPSDEMPKIEKIKRSVSRFDYPKKDSFKGKPLVCSSNWKTHVENQNYQCLVAISSPTERYSQISYAKKNNIKLINAIHPSTILLKDVIIGKNVIVLAGAVLGYRAEICDGVIINIGVQIDHHSSIGTCASIDPGTVLAGNVTIGKCSVIHTNATVINKIKVGENTIIGAGAVVIADVLDNDKVVGVPAKTIKN
jgi:sugar O-acyltransferase (sialic acid O-acetyltransferase NeuD family)